MMDNRWFEDEELEQLPWRNWKNGGGSWIFADEAEVLSNKIKMKGTIRIGDFIYELRHLDGKVFIVRRLAKGCGEIKGRIKAVAQDKKRCQDIGT
jgi:hypothetical protein